MIKFNSVDSAVAFLEKNLPPKIKNEVFNRWVSWEHKGKTVGNWQAENPRQIIENVIKTGFMYGLSENEYELFPDKFILMWSKLKKFMKSSDTLSMELDKYALISVNKACEFLDITRPTLYKLLKEKKIPFIDVMSQKRIQLKDLIDYVESEKKLNS